MLIIFMYYFIFNCIKSYGQSIYKKYTLKCSNKEPWMEIQFAGYNIAKIIL